MPGEDQGAIPVPAPGCDTTTDRAGGQRGSEEADRPSPRRVGGRGRVKGVHPSSRSVKTDKICSARFQPERISLQRSRGKSIGDG